MWKLLSFTSLPSLRGALLLFDRGPYNLGATVSERESPPPRLRIDNVMATPDLKTLAELADTLGLTALYKLDPEAFAAAYSAAKGLKSRASLPQDFFDEPAHTATFIERKSS